MKEGSIVARTREIKPDHKAILAMTGRKFPEMHEPCVIKRGPYKSFWHEEQVEMTVILLEEYPEEFNISYFSELQPPLAVSIEEFIGEPVEVLELI